METFDEGAKERLRALRITKPPDGKEGTERFRERKGRAQGCDDRRLRRGSQDPVWAKGGKKAAGRIGVGDYSSSPASGATSPAAWAASSLSAGISSAATGAVTMTPHDSQSTRRATARISCCTWRGMTE